MNSEVKQFYILIVTIIKRNCALTSDRLVEAFEKMKITRALLLGY